MVSADVQHAHYKCVAENLLGSDYVLYSILRLGKYVCKQPFFGTLLNTLFDVVMLCSFFVLDCESFID